MWTIKSSSLGFRASSYRELDHEGVNDAADDGDEVKSIPRVLEVAL